jgi:hypothetical protein
MRRGKTRTLGDANDQRRDGFSARTMKNLLHDVRGWLVLALFLGSPVAHGQGCPVVGISCQASSVGMDAISDSRALEIFESFSSAEQLRCRTLPGAPHITLSCNRVDGIWLELRREGGRLWFVSRAPYGLKGNDTLRAFNSRLGSFLASQFKDAAETIHDAPPIPKVDRFSGRYLSESRDQFGTSVPAEIRIEVTREGATYLLKYFHNEKPLFTTQAEECDPRRYPISGNDWTNANVSALCTPAGHMQILYSESGVTMREPANPSRRRLFQSNYYSHVQWGFYAFRKVH